jgi:hypothetical protein
MVLFFPQPVKGGRKDKAAGAVGDFLKIGLADGNTNQSCALIQLLTPVIIDSKTKMLLYLCQGLTSKMAFRNRLIPKPIDDTTWAFNSFPAHRFQALIPWSAVEKVKD